MKRRDFLKSVAAASAGAAIATKDAVALQSAEPLPAHWGQPHVPPNWGHAYPLGPDSEPRPGVPRGDVFRFDIVNPDYFPGMQCPIDVYIPVQYRADRPACVAFLFDGLIENAQVVFDNLIHQGEMPVTIGIGMVAGRTLSMQPPMDPRFDRSFEFDSTTEVMANFIVHEVLPEVQKRKTPDGLPILLSDDPNDRLIGGSSSGGIGAFNAAWHRPDAFRRVCIMSGTFVGMRGADRYPTLICKTEPKPLRVLINDGTHDEWWGGPEFGNWWLSNEEVEDALTFAGYQVNHIWGIGGHGEQNSAVFPDIMRWLWKDWPKPVEADLPGNFNIQAIIQIGATWQSVKSEKSRQSVEQGRFRGYNSPPVLDVHSTAAAIASNQSGQVFFINPSEGRICQVQDDGTIATFTETSPGNSGLAFAPDGRLLVAETARSRVVAYDRTGHRTIIAEGLSGRHLTVTHKGDIYMTESEASPTYTGKVWLLRPSGEKHRVADGLNGPSGLVLTPDGMWLSVAEHNGHRGWNYQIQPDGTLQYGLPSYWFHVPDSANDSGIGQVCMDRDGRGYAATRMGIQVFDRNGRVTAILPVLPSAASRQLAGICFGGPDFKTLYVTTGSAVYRRQVSTVGSPGWSAPITLPHWGMG